MTNEQAQKIIAQQNAQAEAFRKHVKGFSAPSDDVVIEKVAEVYDDPTEVQIGNGRKKVTPVATIARIENTLIMIPGKGERLTKSQAGKFLDSAEKGNLTRALNTNFQSRVEKLVPA